MRLFLVYSFRIVGIETVCYNMRVKMRKIFISAAAVFGMLSTFAQNVNAPGAGTGAGLRYATDAYPGFDSEDEMVKPSKKEPKWFSWLNGPNRANAKDQLSYCVELMKKGDDSKAAKQLDALVREWPTSPEAPKAQRALAELRLKELDFEEAFKEMRYLIDFYSLHVDYNQMADELYKIACMMHKEGKTIVFFRFKNTVDVRRAFETCVLRAPGATWTPQAMLTIAALREEEGKLSEAVKVYENLRNIHSGSVEAKKAVALEAGVRMRLLSDYGYNRERAQDTVNYLRYALVNCDQSDVQFITDQLKEAVGHIEKEAFNAAKFYDSRTRTVRSAINAYERFLSEYPDGIYAEAARNRLEELKSQKGNE